MLSALTQYLTYIYKTQWILPSYLINEFEATKFDKKKVTKLELVCLIDQLMLVNSEREALQLPVKSIEKVTGTEEKGRYKFKIHLCNSQ